MNIENLVFKYKDGSLDAVVIKVESNEAMEEFYDKYTMREICFGIEKSVKSKFKGILKTFLVEYSHIDDKFSRTLFKYSSYGLTDSLEDEIQEAVLDVVKLFGFKIKL